jgi:hypothetical protein
MKFDICYDSQVEDKLLLYRRDEFSFDMEPWINEIDFEIAINTLTLSVVDNTVIQLSGFCGFNGREDLSYQVPEFKSGVLKVADNLESGFAYKIFKEDLPVYVSEQTGWVCIGSPEMYGRAVEIIRNCIVVISSDKEFVSLWLKPHMV